jgi:hypothetical protein
MGLHIICLGGASCNSLENLLTDQNQPQSQSPPPFPFFPCLYRLSRVDYCNLVNDAETSKAVPVCAMIRLA